MPVTKVDEMKAKLAERLRALEKTWDDFTPDCELKVAESKLEHWVKETEKLLSGSSKERALQGISRIACETATDRESQFFERVKKYRMFLSLLIQELDENSDAMTF